MPSFSNPIRRSELPFRHEGSPLRHLRDGDSIGREWQKAKKDNSMLSANANALERLDRIVKGLRKPKFVMDRWHPFKIYNVPPHLCNSPEDSWRTFRVRAGLVSWRSMFKASSNQLYDEEIVESSTGSDKVGLSVAFAGITNPENGFQDDFIPAFNQYDGTMESVSVPATGTAGVTATSLYGAEFVLNSALDNNNERWAEFWLEVNDPNDEDTHTTEITAEVRCRMFQFPSGTRPGLLTPEPHQFPIGIVCVRRGSDAGPLLNEPAIGYRIEQYVYDHMLRRYPVGYWNASIDMASEYISSTGGMIFRGTWDGASAWADTIFYDMAFYPGDVLQRIDSSGTPILRSLFVYSEPPDYNVAEPGFGGNTTWKEMFYTEYS